MRCRPIRIGRVGQRRFTSATSTAAAAAAADAGDTGRETTGGGASPTEKMVLHNTMSRKKEVFNPREGNGDRVTMYVCGVTVYDYSHIGHARVYVAFDVLYRQLTRWGGGDGDGDARPVNTTVKP